MSEHQDEHNNIITVTIIIITIIIIIYLNVFEKTGSEIMPGGALRTASAMGDDQSCGDGAATGAYEPSGAVPGEHLSEISVRSQ